MITDLPAIETTTLQAVDPARIAAREAYLRVRRSNKTPGGAISMIVQSLRTQPQEWPEGATPPDNATVLWRWCTEDNWEETYRQRQVAEVLAEPQLQPHVRLKEALEQRRVMTEALETAAGRLKQPDHTAADEKAYDRLWTQIRALDAEIDRLEEVTRRQEFERAGGVSRWMERTEVMYQELMGQYRGYGAVYEFLCRQAAEVRVRIEQMQAGGRAISTDEFARIYELHARSIAALQKYTETMKSSTVSEEVQEAMTKLLSIIEAEISNESPYLWQRVVRAVKQRAEGAQVTAGGDA